MSGVSSSAAGPGTGEETLQASALGEPSSTTTTMHVNPDVQSGSGLSDNEDPMKDRPWIWQNGVWRRLPTNAVKGVGGAWEITYTAWFEDEQANA